MEKYEYKFVKFSFELGFDFKKKCDNLEKEWNELGSQGWKFCKEGNGVYIFMRKIYESDI